MTLSIVVDVGGTTTRLAPACAGALVGAEVSFATTAEADPVQPVTQRRERLLDRVADAATRLYEQHVSAGECDVGVAFGAVIDGQGVVRDASVLWHEPSTGFDVRAGLSTRLPWARVHVLNDVTAAAWQYQQLGRFALVTVSTGVAVKVFDDSAGSLNKVLTDASGLGGEVGHVVVEPARIAALPGGGAAAVRLGRAAADGDLAARAELERLDLPWCDCGTVADLCAYSSGPAVARAAVRRARRHPEAFADSALSALTSGTAERIDTHALAAAAGAGDAFAAGILRDATLHLAVVLLQTCANLGLRRVVVVGGFAHGVGEPWFAALRANIREFGSDAGWFRGWTPADWDALLHVPADADSATLSGIARYLSAQQGQARVVMKPVGEARLALTFVSRPRCGRDQFLLRIVYAGLCATDLQILRGERGLEPGVPGHECVAQALECGANVVGLSPGDWVTLNPNHPTDGYAKLGHNMPGVFQDVFVGDVGLLATGQVIPIPSDAGPDRVLLEPLAAVWRAQDALAERWDGQYLLVVGGGVLGLLHAMVGRARGARVLLAVRDGQRLRAAVAAGMPAPYATVPAGPELAGAVRAATDGAGADAAVIAVGAGAGPAALDRVWPALADLCCVHLFGGFAAGVALQVGGGTVDPGPLRSAGGRMTVRTPAGGRCDLTGSRGGRRQDFSAAINALPLLDLAPLVSHRIPLEALPGAAAELLEKGTLSGTTALRVVVDTGARP